jgi:hypothetical protein
LEPRWGLAGRMVTAGVALLVAAERRSASVDVAAHVT